MDKRGNSFLETQIIWAFYLILAIIIYFMIANVASEKSFFDDYFARELGLSIDSLHNSPGNLKIEYKNLKDFNLKIKENFIQVQSSKKNLPRIYVFARDKNYQDIDENFAFMNESLIISRQKNKITLDKFKEE